MHLSTSANELHGDPWLPLATGHGTFDGAHVRWCHGETEARRSQFHRGPKGSDHDAQTPCPLSADNE